MFMDKEKRQLKPYQGLIIFVLVILIFLFVAAPIQELLGLYGVLLTEVMILAISVIATIVLKADLKEVFPIKKPKARQIMGVIVLWIGSVTVVLLVTLIIGYFFPEGLTQVSDSLQDVFTSLPMGIAFLIIAGSPAICEEALVRGFILSSFQSLQKKWLIVLIVGIIFGIFHLDFYRFLPTAILGMALTYIMIETKNILMPALFHFINNGFSTIVSFLTAGQTDVTAASVKVPLVSIGAYFIICAVAPFLLLAGMRLLQAKKLAIETEDIITDKKHSWKGIIVASISCILMVAVGAVIIIYSLFAYSVVI
jgi:membrane protease YdiL (CAAX protease family)